MATRGTEYLSTDPNAGQGNGPIIDWGQSGPGPINVGKPTQINGPYAPASAVIGPLMLPNGKPAPTTGQGQGQTFPMGGGPTLNTMGTTPNSGNPMDDAYINSVLQGWAGQPGADPILNTPEGRAYYAQKIKETGGLTSSNLGYWQNKSRLASFGGAVGGAGGAAGGGGGFGTFGQPSLEEARNSPGYQFAFDQGQRAVQTSAASKGTLLTGGTLKDLAQFGTGLADQTYGNVFNRALQTHQTQYGDLYNLANLGLQGSKSSVA